MKIFILLLLIISCSSEKPQGKTAAEVLYKEAKLLKEDGKFILALEKLNTIKSQHPYSFYSTHAELMQADIYFEQESYVEAAAAYILFRDFHPKHKKRSYVIWKIAEAYFYQLPDTFDRDLSPAFEAVKYYQEILTRYSSSKYIPKSKEKVAIIHDMIEKKDRYIADFYFKTEVYDSARYRYLNIIKIHKNRELRAHSMRRVIESSLLMKNYSDCIKYSKRYISKISPINRGKIKEIRANCTAKLDSVIKNQDS